jgi:NAD(P)H dehydrogenase (quinone)
VLVIKQGVKVTFRDPCPGFFADSPYLEMMPFAVHLGVFPLPVAGESRNAPPSVDDIGRVVGHKVRHVRTPLGTFYKGAKAQGREPFLLSGLRYWFQDNDRGAFAVGAPNETVRELTGKEAEDFETIARRHAALPASRQSFGARLAVFARFLAVPILPGFDPVAYDLGQEQPVPPTPRLALDDADWRASHGSEGSAVVHGTLKEALA